PLLVFVNSKSGPQQGNLLITQFRRLLNPIQVWDLGKGGPEKVLKSFSVLSRFQILVCGGDGTVSWIISALEKMDLKRWPPIGILPLGTGNDLARVHGWGGGYNNESLLFILRQISEAYVSMLDLWELDITDKKGRRKDTKSFINYLGVGVDAQAALQVHNLRESKPKLFFSRFYNKVWYAIAGGEEAIKSSCANISQQIVLVADGVEIPLPPDSQGIIFLNIDSYSGGVPMWSKGQKPKRKRIRRHNGLLDVVSIRGTFHLGQIRVGLSNAQLLCQCREAVVTLKKKVAVQIDGEPWRQNQSVLRINRK
ncbi:diacylglycerol kinase, partial [Thalassiosira pseudonana CCMP1335]